MDIIRRLGNIRYYSSVIPKKKNNNKQSRPLSNSLSQTKTTSTKKCLITHGINVRHKNSRVHKLRKLFSIPKGNAKDNNNIQHRTAIVKTNNKETTDKPKSYTTPTSSHI